MNTEQTLERKVFSFMEKHHMLQPGDKVVAGISGGADSVCLLFVLLAYRKRVPFSLAVVHVNHGIRQEAGDDEKYVEELCRTLRIPFYPVHADVRQRAKQEKCSEEEAGRMARYEAFEKLADEWGAGKIAVAHNANDRSETMLFQLFRGSDIKGLGSIRPVRGRIIRPILCLERREVEAYLQARKLACCQDATNETDDYTRNRIRHHIIPYAEKELVSGCVSHMAQTADMLAETEEYLKQQTELALRKCVEDGWPRWNATDKANHPCQKMQIDIEKFLEYHSVIRRRMLYEVLVSLAGSAKDISQVHVRDLLTLFTESGNRTICLPYALRGRREYGKVFLECAAEEETQEAQDIVLPKEDAAGFRAELPFGTASVMRLSVLKETGIFTKIPQNEYTKWFDYDKIKGCLTVRCRQQGDYLTIADGKGNWHHKSLKDYMIAEKIPRSERDRILLLAEDNHVIWLIGYRISEYYKISRNTKRILQVQLIGKSCDSSETEEKNG